MSPEKKLTPAGQWYRNRDEWIRYVLERRELTPDTQRVGIFIAVHTNRRDNYAKHQQQTIADALGVHVMTVRKAIKKLREEGLIEREQFARGKRNRAVNQYYLLFPWLL